MALSDFLIPFPHAHNEITETIGMGGAIKDPERAFERYDILVLCSEYQPYIPLPEDTAKRVFRHPYDDTYEALTPACLESLHTTADKLAEAHATGCKILVTCLAGRNRSGLLTALLLKRVLGISSKEAVALIKERRGPLALTNSVFVSYLMSLR